MSKLLIMLSVLAFVACGKGKNGSDGADAKSNLGLSEEGSISVDLSDIDPGLACANGGVSIFTFRDLNSDGVLDVDESVIKVKSICNGAHASIALESISSSSACPEGGVKISSSSSTSVEVCNGADGLNGEQGIQGAQGIPGMTGSQGVAGADGAVGTIVTPVKFCSNDNSTYPEYGLMIGSELYAVYWGSTPGSSSPQAFLTKLVAGNYQSTGGNNCLFSVP